ncbi:MAG TPA: class I SAM-dependent methyltransferase [Candidatus Saccharimonadales bacterium]|nr:class I SAM-dependent methyltransferase [Candidatus Saccharimonadales bacterium]
MVQIPDQTQLWNEKHGAGDHSAHRGTPAPFALVAEPFFPRQSHLLEIGCGVGSESQFFADCGHDVLATDISEVVLDQDKEYYKESTVSFALLDVSEPLPFDNGSFQVVFSHLALHYYTDEVTRTIFAELYRILETGGVLAFACKSTKDAKYGLGEELEKDMFLANGKHLRHFFTIEYIRSLLGGDYEILLLDEVMEQYSKDASGLVRCVARKK